jgi:hypothetical protein
MRDRSGKWNGIQVDSRAFAEKAEAGESEGPDEDSIHSSASLREYLRIYSTIPATACHGVNERKETESHAEVGGAESSLAEDWVVFDMTDSSSARIVDRAGEPDQDLVDNGTIEVDAVAESGEMKAYAGTRADSCGTSGGDGRIALDARRPYQTDVVHCVAERPAAPETAYDGESSSPLMEVQCLSSRRAAPTPGWQTRAGLLITRAKGESSTVHLM